MRTNNMAILWLNNLDKEIGVEHLRDSFNIFYKRSINIADKYLIATDVLTDIFENNEDLYIFKLYLEPVEIKIFKLTSDEQEIYIKFKETLERIKSTFGFKMHAPELDLAISDFDDLIEFISVASNKYCFESFLESDLKKVSSYFLLNSMEEHIYEELLQESKKDRKRIIKRIVYTCLKKVNNIQFPWGSLSGIRPSYVAGQLWQKIEEICEKQIDTYKDGHISRSAFVAKCLEDFYDVSRHKACLATDVAERERILLCDIPDDAICMYIHIPFCSTRCTYCSFPAKDGIARDENVHDLYIEALLSELELFFKNNEKTIYCLYIGGGTPSVFNCSQIKYFLSELNKVVPLSNIVEKTFEAGRIDSLSKEKLEVISEASFDRMCINPQSMNEETLRKINRSSNLELMPELIAHSREQGINYINSDLIAGLKDESPDDFYTSLQKLLKLNVDSISLHSLALKKKSTSWSLGINDEIEFNYEKIFNKACDLLISEGYKPYYLYRNKVAIAGLENISFAKHDKYCLYNIMMMSDKFRVISFGAGSMSKNIINGNIKRLATAPTVEYYLKNYQNIALQKRAFFK